MATGLSPGEKRFVVEGVALDVRSDGRSRLEHRCMVLQTGVVTGCNGSARLRVANTDVLVGVKVDLGEPHPDFPEEGRLQFSVDCCANAVPENRNRDEINIEIERCLERIVTHSSALDLKNLCIRPGQQCWVVFVDVVVLDSSGSMFDAVSIATKAALSCTRLPKYSLVGQDDDEVEIEISDDPDEGSTISVQNMPVCISLTKIGNHFVADATAEEEVCCEARLTFAVNNAGHVFTVQKGGSGGVDPSLLAEMLQVAEQLGTRVCGNLDQCLAKLDQSSNNTNQMAYSSTTVSTEGFFA